MPDFAGSSTTELDRKVAALKWVALTETVSYSVLFVFWVSGNRLGTALLGSLHGMVFLAFAAMTLGLFRPLKWSYGFLAVALLTGPIGGVAVYAVTRRVKPDAVPPAAAARAAAPTR